MRLWLKHIAVTSLLTLCACAPSQQNAAAVNPEPSAAALSSVTMDETAGCMTGPIAQFGRYIGDWTMTSETLSREDGKTWQKSNNAQWNFKCVGNGIAVQDFWIPETGGYGSNLRMYDPNTKKWDIAWVSTGTPAMSHISAKQDEAGNIIMHYVTPIPTPLRRITFFTPTAEGWDWHLDMSQDGGENWLTVVKMQARPS